MESKHAKYTHICILLVTVCICVFVASASFAQNPDTLKILSAQGTPDDTVSVFVNLANHSDSIGGFILNIAYNINALEVADVLPTSRIDGWSQFSYSSPTDGIIHVVAYAFIGEPPVPIGSEPIVELKFRILSTAPRNSPVIFETIEQDQDNTISNWNGSMLIFPALINGVVINEEGVENDPPVFTEIPLNPQYVNPGGQLQFEVEAYDPDGDFISLSANNLPANSNFAGDEDFGQVTGTFTFNPVVNQGPDTFYVNFIVEDIFNLPVQQSVTIYLLEGGGNQPPVIYPIGAQVVAEGAHVEFEVRAYDPEGDIITLDANNVPPNAQFEVVQGDSSASSTFYFDPDFTQGPDTIFVTFVARDDYNNVTNMSVQIIILDAPNDFLEVEPDQGALPGTQHRSLNINLRNAKPIYGLQFDLIYDPEVLDIFSAVPDSARAYDLAFFSEIIEEGRYRIVIFSLGLDSIKTGSGNIVEFMLDVDPFADIGPSEVLFDSASSVQDSLGASKDIISFAGAFNIDLLGDANLDDVVSVGDCVAVIAHLLSWIELNIRAFDAADYNRDGDVRIADLMEIVNHILGHSGAEPPPLASAGSVELIRDKLYPGFQGEVPLWLSLNTEAAAVQFTIKYDPSEIEFYGVTAGDMISDLELQFNDTGNEINVVIYNFNLSEFGPGDGALVNLDMKIIGDQTDPSTAINVVDFEIVNVDAHALNVEVLGELPSQFTLNQNYPNPFNATTLISFEMPFGSFVEINVYNVLGQMVNELYSGYLEAGPHQVMWDGTGLDSKTVTSGIYFYRFQADGINRTKKMLLVK